MLEVDSCSTNDSGVGLWGYSGCQSKSWITAGSTKITAALLQLSENPLQLHYIFIKPSFPGKISRERKTKPISQFGS